jgi:hypothetical protein
MEKDELFWRLVWWFWRRYTDSMDMKLYETKDWQRQLIGKGPYDSLYILHRTWGAVFADQFLGRVSEHVDRAGYCRSWYAYPETNDTSGGGML